MTNKKTDPLKAAKDTIKKAKGSTTANITTALDVNKDGTVDIQDIIILAFKMPWVHVNREAFLRRELLKRYPKETISKAISSSPALAGIPEHKIDEIADDVINYERNCVSGISTALGMPGGISLAATIPADIAQYYGYTLRAIQKLLYLYGFPEIDTDEDGLVLDSATVNRIVLCLGVMYGVAGANNAIKAIAKALSVGVEKKLLSMALTKGTLYPILKSVLKWFGVKLTKDLLAKSVKNAIPVIGGVVGGGITFISFKPCCLKLQDALKDTVLSNPGHVSSAEEDEIFTCIIDGDVCDTAHEELQDAHDTATISVD